MNKTVRKTSWFNMLLIPILLLSFFISTPINASAETDLGLNVDAAILIDADTGKILYEQNADVCFRYREYDKNDDRVYSFGCD
ncbi:hypothetical protein UACE39S_06081 [Ureibacillus acetophenoni]